MPTPIHYALALAALFPLLSGCAGAPDGGVRAGGQAPPRHYVPPPVAHRAPLPSAHLQSLPGLDGVIGATGPELARVFGPARLDVPEGDARKLQFVGGACVLDVYLYPLAPGREAQATYVDARRGDGRDVDRAACVAALRRK